MFKKFSEWLEEREEEVLEEGTKTKKKKKKWIQKAIDPSHEGFCTPMTKKTCTPRRKALAKTLKKLAKKKQ
jgi:hypothetical protein